MVATSLCESAGGVGGKELMQKVYKELLEGLRIGGGEGDEVRIENNLVMSS